MSEFAALNEPDNIVRLLNDKIITLRGDLRVYLSGTRLRALFKLQHPHNLESSLYIKQRRDEEPVDECGPRSSEEIER